MWRVVARLFSSSNHAYKVMAVQGFHHRKKFKHLLLRFYAAHSPFSGPARIKHVIQRENGGTDVPDPNSMECRACRGIHPHEMRGVERAKIIQERVRGITVYEDEDAGSIRGLHVDS